MPLNYLPRKKRKIILVLTTLAASRAVKKPKNARLRLAGSIRNRLKAIDKILDQKRETSKDRGLMLPLCLHKNKAAFYNTGEPHPASSSNSLPKGLEGILEQNRRRFLYSSSVTFNFNEIDLILKALFRILEIWSFTELTTAVIGDKIEELEKVIPPSHQEIFKDVKKLS